MVVFIKRFWRRALMFEERAKLFQEYIRLNEGEQVKFVELKDNEKEFYVITLYIYKLISASRYDEAYYILNIPRIKDIIYGGYPDITPIRFFVHQFDNFDELLSLCFDSVLHRNMTMARTAMSIVDTRLSQLDTVKIQIVKELINKEKLLTKFAESTIYFGNYNKYPTLFYKDFKESDIDKEVLNEHTQAENIIAFAMDLHDVELYDMEIYYLERLIKCRPDNKEVHICLAAAKLSEALSYNSFPDGIAFQVCDLYYKLIQLLNNDTEKSAYSLAFYEYLINISGKYLDQWRGKEPDRLISLCSFYNMLLNLYYIYPLKQFLYLIEEDIIKYEYNSKDNLVIHFQEQMHNILLHRNEILL
jgi:hypothetical protein